MSSFVLEVLGFTYRKFKCVRLLNIPSGRDVIAFDVKLLSYTKFTEK